MITRCHMDFKKYCKLVFGSYLEARDYPTVTKNTTPITHECIALGPTQNLQGTQQVFFIETSGVLKIRKFIHVVSSDRVIIKVNNWCKKYKLKQY